jgi:L-lysine 2,3-aminomutase
MVLLAQVVEQSHEVIDTAMARLSGTVVRQPVVDVEAELAAAQKAQKEAKKKAREELRTARREKAHDNVQAKVAELKAKLGGDKDKDKAAAGATS